MAPDGWTQHVRQSDIETFPARPPTKRYRPGENAHRWATGRCFPADSSTAHLIHRVSLPKEKTRSQRQSVLMMFPERPEAISHPGPSTPPLRIQLPSLRWYSHRWLLSASRMICVYVLSRVDSCSKMICLSGGLKLHLSKLLSVVSILDRQESSPQLLKLRLFREAFKRRYHIISVDIWTRPGDFTVIFFSVTQATVAFYFHHKK